MSESDSVLRAKSSIAAFPRAADGRSRQPPPRPPPPPPPRFIRKVKPATASAFLASHQRLVPPVQQLRRFQIVDPLGNRVRI